MIRILSIFFILVLGQIVSTNNVNAFDYGEVPSWGKNINGPECLDGFDHESLGLELGNQRAQNQLIPLFMDQYIEAFNDTNYYIEAKLKVRYTGDYRDEDGETHTVNRISSMYLKVGPKANTNNGEWWLRRSSVFSIYPRFSDVEAEIIKSDSRCLIYSSNPGWNPQGKGVWLKR
jgi:hypothetical protein